MADQRGLDGVTIFGLLEECFELAKGECGLDGYEVRGWTGWHRHVTLSLFALAVVAIIRSRAAKSSPRKRGARR